MSAPGMRPARPREPRPELVAAIVRRNAIRNIDRQIALIRRGPRTPENGNRIDRLLDQRHALTGKSGS